MIPMPGHVAEKQDSTAGSNQSLSSVHLEHALNCWKPSKDHLAGQEGLPPPSSGVTTYRSAVGWGSRYPQWKNITFLSFHESRISYHHVPCAWLLSFSWNRPEQDSLCTLACNNGDISLGMGEIHIRLKRRGCWHSPKYSCKPEVLTCSQSPGTRRRAKKAGTEPGVTHGHSALSYPQPTSTTKTQSTTLTAGRGNPCLARSIPWEIFTWASCPVNQCSLFLLIIHSCNTSTNSAPCLLHFPLFIPLQDGWQSPKLQR